MADLSSILGSALQRKVFFTELTGDEEMEMSLGERRQMNVVDAIQA